MRGEREKERVARYYSERLDILVNHSDDRRNKHTSRCSSSKISTNPQTQVGSIPLLLGSRGRSSLQSCHLS